MNTPYNRKHTVKNNNQHEIIIIYSKYYLKKQKKITLKLISIVCVLLKIDSNKI